VNVEAIEASSNGVRVHAGGRECRAGAVVLATNAYTCQLLPEVQIRPVRGQMLATAADRSGLVPRPTYSHRGFRYWRQLADGRVLVGGFRDHALAEEVGYEARTTPRIQGLLEGQAGELGTSAPVRHRWAGIMGFTEDELPIVGQVSGRPNVYLCAGYSGHGMGFAFHCAKRVAAMLTG
jgi:glycine/D-amino acid oxidase-like deaminating enzyme